MTALLNSILVTGTVDGAEMAHYDFGSAPTSDEVGLFTISAHTHFDNWESVAITPTVRHLEDFSGQPHAAREAADDHNGNMVLRVESVAGQVSTYTQQFDVDNRLTAVTVTQAGGSPQVTRFAYDGDGERYREDAPGGGVTLYVGELQELKVAGGQVLTRTSYYYHGDVRVGMRVAGVVYYLHADHLGSTTLTTDEGGDVVARRLYRPYGATRYVTGTLTTDYAFTGQADAPGLGLVYMHARWYHPYLNRWTSADALVPNPGRPQDLNRYAYVGGNPIGYSDPSGHMMWVGGGGETARILAEYRAPVEQTWLPEVVAVAEAQVHQPTAAEWALLGGALVGTAALPVVLEASFALFETVGYSTLTWSLAHPVEALVAKAVAEEGLEATITGTPFDPGMVLLDLTTQVGDDYLAAGEGRYAPNPYGRRGGPAHQATVQGIEAQIKLSGLRSVTEFQISTPGGARACRYADVAALDVNDQPVALYQVGRTIADGRPVARERYAMTDIAEYGNYPGVPITFVPYDQ